MRLSIVIPTYSRLDALQACLESIAAQSRYDRAATEVLVLNDGGDPGAESVLKNVASSPPDGSEGLPESHRYLHLAHAGPSAVRNIAAREAKGDLLLILNDDVTLGPGHLATHLAFHKAADNSPKTPRVKSNVDGAMIPLVAGKGRTQWADDSMTTTLMQWLARQSFFYYLITDLGDIGYEFYHTCDLSIPRRLVTEFATFDEAFDYPGFEDTEWGWRLEALGVKLAFLQNAVTEHHHVYDEAALIRRGEANGCCAAVLLDRVPELRDRAIDDFIRSEEIPGGELKGVARRIYRKYLEITAIPGDSNIDVIRFLKKAEVAWAKTAVPADGPDRWTELARRAHVKGFIIKYAQTHGVAYPI